MVTPLLGTLTSSTWCSLTSTMNTRTTCGRTSWRNRQRRVRKRMMRSKSFGDALRVVFCDWILRILITLHGIGIDDGVGC